MIAQIHIAAQNLSSRGSEILHISGQIAGSRAYTLPMAKVRMRVTVAVLFAAIIGVLPGAAASAVSSYPPGVDYVYGATNTYRTTSGVSALAFNTSLQSVAQAWAEKMAADDAGGMTTQQAFRHNPVMTLQIPSGWLGAGENIALNGGYSDPYAKLMDQWKTSPAHNTNMLNPNWTDIGVGVFTDSFGITWGVQVFAEYPPTWVPPVITLSGPSTLALGGTAHFSVAVDPSASGTLGLQYQVPGGSWITSAMTVPLVNGVASFALAPKVEVSYRVMLGGAVSNAVTVVPTGAA